jgi:hypothetical protein
VRAAVLVAVVVLAGAALWNAGELHYRNCVEAAKHAVSSSGFGEPVPRRVAGCSRLPF